MIYLYVITGLSLIISYIADKNKTKKAIIIAFKKFNKVLPPFVNMIILVSIVLFLLPDNTIVKYLNSNNMLIDTLLASLIGSITILPGFIAFPLGGIFLEKGISYTVISAFTTSLMMVGIITFPVEKEYFGVKLTLVRNIFSYIIGIIVAITIGIFFGEIVL